MEKYQEYLLNNSVQLKDLAYTLGIHREHMPYKAFGVAIGNSFQGSPVIKSKSNLAPSFVFTGQGAQWAGMGKELMEDYDAFRASIRAMDASLSRMTQPPLWKIEGLDHFTPSLVNKCRLFVDELLRPEDSSMISKAELSQPLCTAVQVALIDLLRTWGVSPVAVVGHSSGEIAAAYAAGAFSSDVAIRLAYFRGLVAGTIKRRGAMAAIGLGRYSVEPFVNPGVVIACENSGSSTTISGDETAVQKTIAKIVSQNPEVFARKLKVGVAYHSRRFHKTDIKNSN